LSKFRIVIAGDYPEDPPSVVGGIQAVIYNTLECLGNYDDIDLHVVTCEKWRSRPLDRVQVVDEGRWMVHYLPSSPRIPHTLSMLTVDRRDARRQIESLDPDLVHAHGQVAAYPFAAFDTGLPTVVTVHGINMLEAQVDPRGGALRGRLRIALWGGVERRCLRRARDIIVISPFVRQVISPHTRARLHVVENPVQDAFFRLEPEPAPGKVLMVGSIQKRKGILEAIKAMALVRQQVPYAELHIAGGFSPAYRAYGDLVRQYVAETGAEAYIRFCGQLGHEALLDAYRTSQAFLFPSYLEASPVALAEAMAAGLPSVVSDIGGTEHLIDNAVTGYRVPVGDVQAIAESAVRLLKEESLCSRLGQQARKVAKAHSTQEVSAHQTHDLYLSLIDSLA
jgi:glycosyltransferase involved in cell wall biosynthesis